MQPTAQNNARTAEIAKIAETEEDIAALQQHLKELLEGAAFRGSHRSGQFLKFIVEQSIAGHFDSLKERAIGMELFGRSPSYDTGEDAIVRVTASDVRRRLLQHYGRYGTTSEFRISLPLGSYIPEITRDPHHAVNQHLPVATLPDVVAAPAIVLRPEAPAKSSSNMLNWLVFGILLIGLNIVVWAIFWSRSSRTGVAQTSVMPWAAIFHSQHPTHLITSDPNIAEIQGLADSPVSLSDYANQQYIPTPNSLSPEAAHIARDILRGDKAAAVDARVVASVASLAQANLNKVNVQVARDVRLSDLYTDDNFIFLGSPRSDPWTALFNDQLDFRFVFDKQAGQEIFQNVHPHSGEPSSYVATALGWHTGQSFATVSFIRNPGKAGHVLLLAGLSGEGTEAAGDLVTDIPSLSAALQRCGIRSSDPVQNFQLLLRLSTMAGSPSNVNVVACHILAGNSAR